MIEIRVKLNSPSGLHARPASILVKEASNYKSDIKILKSGKEFNLKSIMGVLSAGIRNQEEMILQVAGDDEGDASVKIKSILEEELTHV